MADNGTSQGNGGSNQDPPSNYESLSEALQRFNVALTNASEHPEIVQAIAAFNYDATRMSTGKTKYDNVVALMANQSKEKGEEKEASKTLHNYMANVKDHFLTARTIGKDVFEGDGNAFTALNLAGSTKSSVSGFLTQAMPFYTNLIATPVFLEKMGEFGYTPEKLTAQKNLVQQVFDADAAYKKEKGEATRATETRDLAFDDLDAWMSKFYLIAKQALKANPQLLKILGI